MYIGRLNAAYTFLHRGTDLHFPPDTHEGDVYTWNWDTIWDTGLDIRLTLPQESFIGSIRVPLTDGAEVKAAHVLVDGSPAGSYTAETDKTASGILDIPVGVEGTEVTVRLDAYLKKIALALPVILGAYEDGTPTVWPSVKHAAYTNGELAYTALGKVTAAGGEDADFAADYLSERIKERLNVTFPGGGRADVAVVYDPTLTGETYRVNVTRDGITLTAGTRLTLLYAVETLIQFGGSNGFRYAEIEDAPYKPMRGFHFGLPPREEMDFAKRVIRYILIPLRYNQLFVEFAGCMRFDRHPEISEAWLQGNAAGKAGTQPPFPHGEMCAGGKLLEKDEVRAFLDHARAYGFEIIPEVQSWGHTQYITYAHPEIAEVADQEDVLVDTRGTDQRPAQFYAHCYCPSHEESYRIIYDIIDEIVEVARPQRYVHMGHDEIYDIGICPRCRDLDHADLYVKHVTSMHDYLAKKGLGMMIWSDMLHPTERYKTPPAIRRLPRDIIFLDFIWYFHFDLDMEDHLLPFGYRILMGNLYSSHYPRFESRIAKEGMLGGQVSTWCRFDEYTLAKKGKFYDLMYTAEMLWNPLYKEGLREIYAHFLSDKLLPRMRDEVRGVKTGTWTKLPVTGCGCGVPKAVAEVCPDAVTVGKGVTVPVHARCAALRFAHTTAWNLPRAAWKPLEQIGSYEVRYTDGSSETIAVEYAGNVMAWNRRWGQPLPQQYYRHQGYIATWFSDPVIRAKDAGGGDVTVLAYLWENPHPEREVAEVVCHENAQSAAGLILAGADAQIIRA